METYTKKELVNKWDQERNKLLSELNFVVEHKFNREADAIRDKIEIYDKLIFDLRYCLK